MLAKLMNEAKGNRREYIAALMKNVTERTPALSGFEVQKAHTRSNQLHLYQRYKCLCTLI